MLTQSLIFLLESLGQLWILAVLLRFFAQTMRAPFRARAGNPLADFIMALTDWAVTPSRRIFPSVFRLDTASIAVAWVATALLSLSVLLLSDKVSLASPTFWPGLLAYSVVELFRLSVFLFIGLMIVQAILSWLNPYHPLQPFFHTMTRSILKPVQNLIPLIGGVDLSPLFVILLLQVLLIGPLAFLGIEAARLMNWMPR
jgi:YggT family protein